MIAWFRRRYLDLLWSIYIYNEHRGYTSIDRVLEAVTARVPDDRALIRIFEVIHRDEPSHWAPYDGWLRDHGRRDPRWWERGIDRFIHPELLFVKRPILVLNPWLRHRDSWQDAVA